MTRAVTLVGFGLLGLALLGMLLLVRLRPGELASPGSVLAAATRTRTGHLLVLLAWAWLGWHVLAR